MLQKIIRIAKNTKILQRAASQKFVQCARKGNKFHQSSSRTFIAPPFTAVGLWGLVKKKDEKETHNDIRTVIEKADALFDEDQYEKIYELLSVYRGTNDIEILWRLSRALYQMSLASNEVEAKKMIYEAYDIISSALSINEDHWAVHKWMAILLDCKSSYEGMKARIQQLNNVKAHMQKATLLNPKDATILYMLGNWCYQVSDLTWYQRKIAAIVFGEPPVSSFQEALEYFVNAEVTDPNFYSHNLLMLGKTYLKLNEKEKAVEYLKMACDFPAKNDDDHKAKLEAKKMLHDIC